MTYLDPDPRCAPGVARPIDVVINGRKLRFSTMTKACNHFGVSGSGKSLSKLKSKLPYGAIVYSTTGEEL
jgi:hypothetical protein